MTIVASDVQRVLYALRVLKHSHESQRQIDCGICWNVTRVIRCDGMTPTMYETSDRILSYFWEDWEYFSGNNDYPVPMNREHRLEYQAELTYDFTENMWDAETEYGKLRLELLDHLIEKMQNYLKEQERISYAER